MDRSQPLFSIYTRLCFRSILMLVCHWQSYVRPENGAKGRHTENDGWDVKVAKNGVDETNLL